MKSFRGLAAMVALVVVGSLSVGCGAQDPKQGCAQVFVQLEAVSYALSNVSKANGAADRRVYLDEVEHQLSKMRELSVSSELAVHRDALVDSIDTQLAAAAKGVLGQTGAGAEMRVVATRIVELCAA